MVVIGLFPALLQRVSRQDAFRHQAGVGLQPRLIVDLSAALAVLRGHQGVNLKAGPLALPQDRPEVLDGERLFRFRPGSEQPGRCVQQAQIVRRGRGELESLRKLPASLWVLREAGPGASREVFAPPVRVRDCQVEYVPVGFRHQMDCTVLGDMVERTADEILRHSEPSAQPV